MSNRTIIYARVSTEDQVEKYGLPSQLRACREYAKTRDLSVIEEVTDDGISGATLDRPGLDRLRKLVAAGQVDVLLMFDVDRLSRELVHLLILKPEIEKKARLEFVASKFEDSPSGRLFFGIRGVVSQYEREQIRERTMRGKRERARTGLIVGGRTAYGYVYKDGRLIPHDTQAKTVREIFAWYEAGSSIRSIARRLKENGIPSWQGNGWGHSSVRRILVNETYAGVAYYGTLRRVGTDLEVRQPVDRVTLGVPALVSREQWERVRARLAANPSNGRPSDKYLLRGILYCSCGRRMSGNCRRSHMSYRCNGRDTGIASADRCRASIRVSAVDQAVWQAIATTFCDEQILRAIIAKRQRELQQGTSSAVDLARLREQLGKLRRREKAALEALLDPDLATGRDSIKAEYRKIQQEVSRHEWEVASFERATRAALDAGAWLDSTVQLIRDYIPTLDSTEQRQEFLRGLVSKVEWDGAAEVKINCLLGSELSTTSARCGQFGTTDDATRPDTFQITLIARVA